MALRCISSLLIFAFLLSSCAAQRPLIKIGMTIPRCGGNKQLAGGQEISLDFWVNYTNSHGGIVVGGVAHDVQLIRYNDASDPKLVGAHPIRHVQVVTLVPQHSCMNTSCFTIR